MSSITANQTAVSELYIALLGRNPDQTGYAFWVNKLNAGETQLQAAAEMAYAPEFFSTYASLDVSTAVGRLYTNVFGRTADTGGLNYWSGRAQTLINSGVAIPVAYAQTATNMVVAGYTNNSTDTPYIQAKVSAATSAGTADPAQGTVTLTPSSVNVTAHVINSSLTPYYYDGVGPTLKNGQTLTGYNTTGQATNPNVLNVSDAYGTATDIMPATLVLNNIQTVALNTAGNAGQVSLWGIAAGDGANNGLTFNTSIYTSVTATNLVSAGNGTDSVQASNGSTITVNHNNVNGAVNTYGGSAVTVSTNGSGGVAVGGFLNGSNQTNPTGAITVNANGYLAGSANVKAVAGTTVTVTVSQASSSGAITIGNVAVNLLALGTAQTAAFNATGAITVTSNSTAAGGNGGAGNVDTIYGGSSVTVSVKGDTVVVGEAAVTTATNNTTGAITVSDMQPTAYNALTGTGNSITIGGTVSVYGGSTVSVTTNDGNDVTIGATAKVGALPTGAITVTDTSSNLASAYAIGGASGQITVLGGTSVTVTAAGGAATIGSGKAADLPTGAILVTETVDSHQNVNIDGGVGVTVNAKGQGVLVGTKLGSQGAIVVNQASVYSGATNYGVAGVGAASTEVDVNGGTTVTVNTTGGNVAVGAVNANLTGTSPASNAGLATGTIQILNTFSGALGANASTVSVLGGASVLITELNGTSGAITVGAAATLNTTGIAGTSISNTRSSPTGNVTINNYAVNGTVTTFGTSLTNVNTNGATQVTILGAGAANITDINTIALTGGPTAGTAAGTSTLATVFLDGVQGAAAIDSNAISTVVIGDSLKANTATTVTIAPINGAAAIPAHLLNVIVYNDTNTGTSLTDAKASSLVVATLDSSASNIAFTTSTATAWTFNNAGAITLGTTSAAALTTVTATGAGALNLGDLSGIAVLKTVNGASATGAITVTIASDTASFIGGAGNDIVTATSLLGLLNGNSAQINGGAGTNTIILTAAAANYNPQLFPLQAVINDFTNFQVLGLSTGSTGRYDVSGFTNVIASGTSAAGLTLVNAGVGESLSITGTPANAISFALASSSGTADAQVINIGGAAAVDALTTNQVSLTAVENVTINSTTTSATAVTNKIAINDVVTTGGKLAYTITGSSALTVSTVAGTSPVSTVTISDTARVDITNLILNSTATITGAAGGVTGGAGQIVVNLDDTVTVVTGTLSAPTLTKNDVSNLTVGSGGAFATLGAGNQLLIATGSNNINLNASLVRDTLVALTDPSGASALGMGTNAAVQGWHTGIGGDALAFSDLAFTSTNATNINASVTPLVIKNTAAGSVVVSGNGTAQYQVSNGVITLTSGSASATQQLQDAEDIVAGNILTNASTPVKLGGANNMAEIQIGTTSYVIRTAAVKGTPAVDQAATTVIQLNGLAGITGFALANDINSATSTTAGTSVAMGSGTTVAIGGGDVAATSSAAAITAMFANVAKTNAGGTSANATYTDTGITLDTWTSIAANNNIVSTYNNLGNFAVLNVTGGSATTTGNNLGNAVVNQVGTNSELLVQVTGTAFANSLTYAGNLVIDTSAAGFSLNSLVSTTGTQVQIVSNALASGAITITAINDPLLTKIDATAELGTGALNLGSTTSYLSQAGLTILSGKGAATVFTSGNGDIFTDLAGTTASLVTATGNADIFNLKEGAVETVFAGGSNDVFNLTSTSNMQARLTGAGASVGATGLGANDVINYLAASSTSNSNVDTVAIYLTGTVTGGTSASYNFTTINNLAAVVANATLANPNPLANQTLIFNNGSALESFIGQVNVASATTLAQALDLAASTAALSVQAHTAAAGKMNANTGIIDWFQFGGNTYIVEANNGATAATHTALGATDVVVKLTGLVDLHAATFSGNTLTL
jgi:hypothetical protein